MVALNQALQCRHLLHDERVSVCLVRIDEAQHGLEQPLIQLCTTVLTLRNVFDRAQNVEQVLEDVPRLGWTVSA